MSETAPGHETNCLSAAIRSAQVIIPCTDLQATMDYFVERLGFRVEVIFPADAPAIAVISGHGVRLRLETSRENTLAPALQLLVDFSRLPHDTPREFALPNGMKVELVEANPPITIPDATQDFVITRARADDELSAGRAGMLYRDLIPTRLGGRFVASHISIPEGGPVPDYVHYHRIRFQMIFCKAGWVRVAYEDQGPAFVLSAGDCVLQPPEIRHRVLEASPGLEVVEVGCPALHETFADHDLPLPNDRFDPDRLFGNQRFVRHVAKDAPWLPWKIAGFEARHTGIAKATSGLAEASVIRSSGKRSGTIRHDGEFLFFFILQGELGVRGHAAGSHQLRENDSCVIPAGPEFELMAGPELEMLAVALPANILAT